MNGVLNDCDALLQAASTRFVDPDDALFAAIAAAQGAAATDAATKAEAARIAAVNAAANYAQAQAGLAATNAAAYADGKVSAEEARAIADATAKAEAARVAAVNAASTDAAAKAEASRLAAIAAASTDATTKASAARVAAESAAATYAQAQAGLAATNAAVYADGKVTAEEARAIADATAKANAARAAAESAAAADATAKANAARTAAEGAAAIYAQAQAGLAATNAAAYADGKVTAAEARAIADATAKAEAARVAAVGAAAADAAAKVAAIPFGSNWLPNSAPGTDTGYTFYWGDWTNYPVENNKVLLAQGAHGYSRYSRSASCVYLHVTGTPPNGANAELWANADKPRWFPVKPGSRYQAGVDLSTHRCTSRIVIRWFNINDAYIAASVGNWVSLNADYTASSFPRSVVIDAAPAGAVYAAIYVQMVVSGQADPFTFASQWLFSDALPNQAIPAVWSEGSASNIRTLGFTGDMNASYGAPVGSMVGSILAQNVESFAGAQAKADAARVAAQDAAAAYAQAQAGLAATNAAAYADGKVTAAEARAIADATAKAEAARVAAINAAAADATAKANLAATTATYLAVPDTRDVNSPPSGYSVGHIKEFKSQLAVGVGPGGYCVVETMKGWQDSSGGEAIQWAYVSASVIYKRSAGASASSWGAWVRDLDRAMYTGDLNATSGAPYGTNVGSTSVALIEQRANSAIAAPTGFSLTGTFGGTVSTSATTIQTLSKQLNATASGAAGPVVYSWVINLVEGAGTYRISSTTDPNPVVTCTASNVATRIGVTCTATDTSTGLSRVNNGVINLNFGAI